MYTYATQIVTCSYIPMWRTCKKIYNIRTCMVGSLVDARLFGSMGEDECDYDHTSINDSSAQDGDKANCSVGEDD
jgi:hypothetical protein